MFKVVSLICVLFIFNTSGSPISSRVINGYPAAEGQFPWQAYLRIFDENNITYICGGSLISQKYVLTAKHCVNNRILFEVRLGSINRHEMAAVFHSTYAILHESFDVALIELPSEVTFDSNIQAVQLPPKSWKEQEVSFISQIGMISGFGFSNDQSGLTDNLTYGLQMIISNEECIKTYGEINIQDHHVCGQNVDINQNVCYGDSGGPFVLEQGGVNYLMGVISFGADVGCEYNYPSGFVRTSHVLDFIGSNSDVIIEE